MAAIRKVNIKNKLSADKIVLRWFWVCAVYKSTQSSASMLDSRQHLYERRVFVIRAVRGQERKVARRVAKSRETRIKDEDGVTVAWQLQEIEGYAELFDKRITSGAEVYWSYFIRVDAPPAQRKPVRKTTKK